MGADLAGIDAYLRRIMVNTQRSWWRARWRQETPAARLPEDVGSQGTGRHGIGLAVSVSAPPADQTFTPPSRTLPWRRLPAPIWSPSPAGSG